MKTHPLRPFITGFLLTLVMLIAIVIVICLIPMSFDELFSNPDKFPRDLGLYIAPVALALNIDKLKCYKKTSK